MQKEKHIYYIFENWELKQDNAHIFISLSLALEPFSLLPVSLLDLTVTLFLFPSTPQIDKPPSIGSTCTSTIQQLENLETD